MAVPQPEPRIARFEKLAYGIFIHWGLYSLLGQGEWAQFIKKIPKAEYMKLKDRFTAEEFDGRETARIARRAGMKYAVLTTRHHDGFSLYDTCGLNDYDAVHSPAGRDLVAEFVEGCRQEGIIPFFYHTTLDWYQESFEQDFDAYLEYLRQSVELLCRNYGDIGGLWFDGNWSKAEADWKEDELYGTIRRYQPEAMIINNTGLSARGEAGHPELDSVTFEQGRPSPIDREGAGKYLAAEMCQTMNTHWGIGSLDFKYMSPAEIIGNLCACRKVGANYLLNVGPTASGRIPDYETAALTRAGDWVRLHEKVLYGGKPCSVAGQGGDFALETDDGIYLFISNLAISGNENVTIGPSGDGPRAFSGLQRKVSSVRWLDNDEPLLYTQDTDSGLFALHATGFPYGSNLVIRVAEADF
ncbi:MAG: alpha-L-fucosidase [bacterium]|nr:alpha-L-fucosidase [bacterium]